MSFLAAITDDDVMRSRADPRVKQILLAKCLETLMGSLHRLQKSPEGANPDRQRELREGALVAVQLADQIRAIDDKLRLAADIR